MIYLGINDGRFFCQFIKPGAIVCLHDASKRTVEALELALPVLYQQGYSFVSLHEMQRKVSLYHIVAAYYTI